MTELIFPGHPAFDLTLATAKRPDWQQVASQDQFVAFCAIPGNGGLLTPLSWTETQDYLESGAWDERMIDELDWTPEELEQL